MDLGSTFPLDLCALYSIAAFVRLQLAADHPVAADEKKAEGEVGLPRRRGSLLRPLGHSDNCTRQVVVSAGRGQGLMAVRVLDELDLGKLMMLVHQVGPDTYEGMYLYVCSFWKHVECFICAPIHISHV